MARKPTDYVQFKLRIRQSLLKQIQKEAAKKKHSANNEAVERLERSFEDDAKELRDSAILDMMVINDDLSGAVLRNMAKQLARNPNWSGVKAAKELLEILSSGKEPQPGDNE
jgi:guanylate kinase